MKNTKKSNAAPTCEVHIASMEQLMPIICECLSDGKSVTIYPRGVSMLPMIRQGIDSVTLSPIKRPLRKYDIILYRRDDGRYVLHRVVKLSRDINKGYTCIGDAQFSYETGVARDSIIAVVASFKRDEKNYSVNSFLYKTYCRFWHFSRPIRRLLRILKIRTRRLTRKVKRFLKRRFGGGNK